MHLSILISSLFRSACATCQFALQTSIQLSCTLQSIELHVLNSVCAYFIPSAQFAILIHSFITSRIDFCNSVYFTLPDYSRSQIQTIQNSCAKCLTGARRFDSAKEALKTLHWLTVKARAHFKILIFAYKIFPIMSLIPLCTSRISFPFKTESV